MSKEIGIGVRVRTGWVPDSKVQPYLSSDPRMKEGVVVDGPFGVGDCFVRPQKPNKIIVNEGPSKRWRVELDCGTTVFPIERLIFPVDDDGSDEVQDEREAETPEETA